MNIYKEKYLKYKKKYLRLKYGGSDTIKNKLEEVNKFISDGKFSEELQKSIPNRWKTIQLYPKIKNESKNVKHVLEKWDGLINEGKSIKENENEFIIIFKENFPPDSFGIPTFPPFLRQLNN